MGSGCSFSVADALKASSRRCECRFLSIQLDVTINVFGFQTQPPSPRWLAPDSVCQWFILNSHWKRREPVRRSSCRKFKIHGEFLTWSRIASMSRSVFFISFICLSISLSEWRHTQKFRLPTGPGFAPILEAGTLPHARGFIAVQISMDFANDELDAFDLGFKRGQITHNFLGHLFRIKEGRVNVHQLLRR